MRSEVGHYIHAITETLKTLEYVRGTDLETACWIDAAQHASDLSGFLIKQAKESAANDQIEN